MKQKSDRTLVENKTKQKQIRVVMRDSKSCKTNIEERKKIVFKVNDNVASTTPSMALN